MKRKLIHVLIWFLIFCSLLTSCRMQEQNDSGLNAPANQEISEVLAPDSEVNNTVIRFAIEDHETAVYEPLIELFEAENPTVKIRLLSTSDILGSPSLRENPDTNIRLMAQSADIFASYFFTSATSKNFVQDLTPFIETDPNFNSTDFYPNSLQTVNGRIHTIPTSINFTLIFYNKERFDASNLAYPQPNWSLQDFLTIANDLTFRDGDTITQWGFVKFTTSWITLFETQLNTPLISTQTDPPTIRFDAAEVIAIARQYETLIQLNSSALTSTDPTLIEERKSAMWLSHYSSLFSPDFDQSWGAVPFPNSSLVGTNGFVMSAATQHPEAAWKWLSFLSYQDQLLADSFLPARSSVAETTQFWQRLKPEYSETMRYALNNSKAFTPSPGYALFDEAINNVISEGGSIEDALAQAQISTEQLLANTTESGEELTPITVDTHDNENSSDRVTIDFWLVNQQNIEGFRTLAEQFEADTNIQVRFRFPNFSAGRPNLTNTAKANDCFQWIFLQDSTYQDSVLNLDPFIAADPSFNLDDFFPTAVAQFTAQGQLWGVPASLNPIIIEFNKELFDASSIPYPTPEWTMDEFLNIGVKLTTGEGQTQQYGFVPDVAEHVLLKEMMVLQGASFLDTSKDPPSTAFTSPEIVDALRWYTNLNREFSIKPTFQAEIGGNDSRELTIFLRLLEEGRAAMWTAYTFPIPPEIYENLNIGTVPLPRSEDHSPLSIQSAGYYISASTEQRQACWQWITHLTESVDVISGVPARRSVAESNAYRQKVGIDRASTYLATLNRLDVPTSLESSIDAYWWMFPYQLWLAKAHDQIVINSIGVEDALVSAQQTFDAYRTCVIESDAFDDRDRQNQCAIEVDPRLAAILGG